MHHRAVGSLCLVSVLFAGCIVPKDAKPTVAMGATFATKFVHRGITLVDNPVVQPRLGIALPTSSGDTIRVDVEANMDLRNNTGGAWFPDGHAGRFSQIEAVASYQKRIGDFDLRAGVHNYNLPNGLEFANGERGATSEVFLLASTTLLDATPYVSLHYDFDEVRGGYYRGGIREGIPLGGAWSLALDGSLGYVSEAQAAWMYGTTGQAGLADLRGEAVVNWQCDARTALRAGLHGSLIVDNGIDDWFAQIGIDSDPIWFTLGVAWTF